MKIHRHDDQFDGHPHPWCGRGNAAATIDVFEATPPALRCALCTRDWFQSGQPDWRLKAAQQNLSANAVSRPGAKTIVHINQHVIRANLKTGANDPVITVKRGKTNTYAHEVDIDGPSRVVYSPDKPLSCGARVWIETNGKVTTR